MKSLTEIWKEQNPNESNSEEFSNQNLIESFLDKYLNELKYAFSKEDELHKMFSDIYVYPDFKEITFKLLATIKDKEEGRKKAKTVQLYHLGARKKKELIGKYGEKSANLIIKDMMIEFIDFTYLFAIQKKYREIAELTKMAIELNEEAINLF